MFTSRTRHFDAFIEYFNRLDGSRWFKYELNALKVSKEMRDTCLNCLKEALSEVIKSVATQFN